MNKRKKWGIILLVWPFAALVFSFLMFAVVNWAFSGTASNAGGDSLFGGSSVISVITNIILFIIGASAVLLGLPSMIMGIVLLATNPQAQPVDSAPKTVEQTEKNGLAIAGMVLGICSIVIWFIGFILGVLAIIFSSIALKRKKFKGLAITGLVTGIVGTVIGIFVAISFITIVAYDGISERANDAAVASDAATVQKQVELFSVQNGRYPTLEEIRSTVAKTDATIVIGAQGVGESESVIYIPCYGDGGIIWYWDSEREEYLEYNVGVTSTCEWN